MRVGVTGSAGFFGWHLRCALHLAGLDITSATRFTFESEALLDDFVDNSDVVVHAAGVNRAESDAEITDTNRSLATRLIEAIQRSERAVPVVYTNSTKSEEGGVYGDAKQAVSDLFAEAARSTGAPYVDLVIPHIFGEYGRPHYNSAVTTFCHQLALGETPAINPDGRLELAYAQDVAAVVIDKLRAPTTERIRITGTPISVGDAWSRLAAMHSRYVDDNTIPLLPSKFDSQLFSTLRSQLDKAGYYPRSIAVHNDSRGSFSELCRADGQGQTSVSTTAPGVTRGDHWHLDKFERFVVVGGRGRIGLRRIETDECRFIDVDGTTPSIVDIPPLTTHNITNTGSETMTTMFWAADHFDPADSDTYPEVVESTSNDAKKESA